MEATSQADEDKMRTRVTKEHDIGHTLDMRIKNLSSLLFSCLAMDIATMMPRAAGTWMVAQ